MFFGEKPDLNNVKTFGCTDFKHIETHYDKLTDKATKEIFVGYSEDSEEYLDTILSLKRLRFLATSPLMRLLLTLLIRT